MERDGITDDLHQTLARIAGLTAQPCPPQRAALAQAASLLAGFVQRYRPELSFENFPLPAAADEVLCSYLLYCEGDPGLTLYLNSIRGGVDSVVHDHGTWVVIVAIEGQERNRIYRRIDDGSQPDRATLELEREVTVCDGQPLVLESETFHSIHTGADQPALQLHLYGRPIDTISGRQIVDLQTGQLVHLGGSEEFSPGA